MTREDFCKYCKVFLKKVFGVNRKKDVSIEKGSEEHRKALLKDLVERGARRRNMSVEQFVDVFRKEKIQEAAEAFQITIEEVVAQGLDFPNVIWEDELERRRFNEKHGTELTIIEFYEKRRQEIKEWLRESGYPYPDCLMPHEIQECKEGGVLDAERLSHLDSCKMCVALLRVECKLKPQKE